MSFSDIKCAPNFARIDKLKHTRRQHTYSMGLLLFVLWRRIKPKMTWQTVMKIRFTRFAVEGKLPNSGLNTWIRQAWQWKGLTCWFGHPKEWVVCSNTSIKVMDLQVKAQTYILRLLTTGTWRWKKFVPLFTLKAHVPAVELKFHSFLTLQ
jgi:hypothetical protein